MPNYKVVDSDQLDADMSGLADTIRAKGGTSASLSFPDGMKAAVEAIVGSGGVPKAVYFKTESEYTDAIGPFVLSKSDYGYLLNCTHLLIVPGGSETTGFSAFINIDTGESAVLVNGGEVDTTHSFSVYIVEGEEGTVVAEDELSLAVIPPLSLQEEGVPPGDYYIVGATL